MGRPRDAIDIHPASEGTGLGDIADRRPVVAMVGRPNVGKSTFLARASHQFVETANAPGTTVGLERRLVTVGGREAWLVDLPGTRSLDDEPAGDEPFWTYLLKAAPDAILVVADAGNLARHLPLALACRDLGLPLVLAVNLTDEAAKHGVSVDTGRLGQLLSAPAHATCGRTGENVDAALGDAVRLAAVRRAVKSGVSSPRATIPAPVYPFPWTSGWPARPLLATEPRSLGPPPCWSRSRPACSAGSSRRAAGRRSGWRPRSSRHAGRWPPAGRPRSSTGTTCPSRSRTGWPGGRHRPGRGSPRSSS